MKLLLVGFFLATLSSTAFASSYVCSAAGQEGHYVEIKFDTIKNWTPGMQGLAEVGTVNQMAPTSSRKALAQFKVERVLPSLADTLVYQDSGKNFVLTVTSQKASDDSARDHRVSFLSVNFQSVQISNEPMDCFMEPAPN
jgi:hypothetical protein